MIAPPKNPIYLKLPRRWSPLRPHPVQYRLWNSPARFKTIHAGRRGGKTETAKRKLVMALWDCLIHKRPWMDPRFFAGAPTRDQAKKIWWKDLKLLTPSAWIRRKYESDLCIVTKWNTELWVMGLDKPDRFEGPGWDGGAIDEFASCKGGIFDANIRPALGDRQGWLWLLGVPDFNGPAQAEYFDMCRVGQRHEDPEWEDYGWNSGDILPASEIESMKRRMSPQLFRQETGGEFVKPSGLACPDFGEANISDVRAEYDPALPICWSLDFNVNPMCSGIIQHHKGVIRVVEEIELPQSNTPEMINAFFDLIETRKWSVRGLEIYGDPTGRARDSTSGVSDWTLIKNALRRRKIEPAIKVPAAPWPIKDTVNAVNCKIKAADELRRLFIHTRCKGLIKDIEGALWPSDLEPQHHLSWLRYFIMYRYPVLLDRSGEEMTTRYGVHKQ